MRSDFASQGIGNRLGIPSVSYPTPILEDLVIVVDVPLHDEGYQAVTLGTPRDGHPQAVLAWQGEVQGDGMKKMVRRIYVTPRAAQDAYNAQVRYLNEDSTCPIFIRAYIERRDTYAPATKGAALGKVTGLSLIGGGSGFTSAPTVVFTGSNTTPATAVAEIQGGAIVALRMTNCGAGYTGSPVVSFTGGGGTGATATALFQPTTAILIEERAQPAPGELSGLFLQIVRIYQTFPGPWLTSYQQEPETLKNIRLRRRIVTNPAAPAQATYYQREIQDTDNYLVSVESEAQFNDASLSGTSREERGNVEYTFPALLFGIDGDLLVDNFGNPTLVLHYNHRSAFTDIVPRRTVITYGAAGTLTPPAVFSPNTADVIFSGISFSVNVRSVLTDSFTLSYYSGTDNPRYPEFTETLEVVETALSATEYAALIGTEICIGAVVKPWRFGLDRMEATYINAQ